MLGHPEKSEAAHYYFTYIDQVEGNDPQAALVRQMDDALALFAAISEERSTYRYAPEKWSIRQALNHVTDTERAMAYRALWFSRRFQSPLESYDQDIAAAGAEADRVCWAAHVEEFRRVRLATISLYANLSPDAWMRTGVASGNPFTVRSLAYIIPGHAAHHVRILRERYQ